MTYDSSVKDAPMKVVHLAKNNEFDADGSDLLEGLQSQPKYIPAKYAYNEIGSKIYEKIMRSDEYYIGRTEQSLINSSAIELIAHVGHCDLVELGSGDSTKTERIIAEMESVHGNVNYFPIDVSSEILERSAKRLLEKYENLEITCLEGVYENGLNWLSDNSTLRNRLFLFFGSSIGNLPEEQQDNLLLTLCSCTKPGDHLLIGLDLQKEAEIFETAYNGQNSAAFNINKLSHINDLFGANFNPENFHHQAIYNKKLERVEAKVHSLSAQTVELGAFGTEISFAEGEVYISDMMRKFDVDDINDQFDKFGFTQVTRWSDSNDWFALALFKRR